MHRREFIQLSALAAVAAENGDPVPQYKISSSYRSERNPNRYPGRVLQSFIEPTAESVERTLDAQMKALTKTKDVRDAWRVFIEPKDVVGIKLNCSGAPKVMSHPLVVGAIAKRLVDVGVKPGNIYLYERFHSQVITVPYADYVPQGVQIHTMEGGDRRVRDLRNYDPATFVEVDFFGEEETRSFMSRLVTEKLTKIIDVPNMKDHGASGVTGCLKNMAYGSFSNVARSHEGTKTHTLTLIGTLFNTEPLRSRTVLHVMDGIKGVWQGGPFVREDHFAFFPNKLWLGTDPVAIDRLLLDVIEEKRKQEGWPSVWDHSPEAMKKQTFMREPGHIEFAGKIGLGVADKSKIKIEEISA